MARQASPIVVKRVLQYSLIADSGFSCFWYYRGQCLFMFLEVSRSAADRIYDLQSYQSYCGPQQIVVMEGKELSFNYIWFRINNNSSDNNVILPTYFCLNKL